MRARAGAGAAIKLVEFVILYCLLFFPELGTGGGGGFFAFSISEELNRLFLYNLPALALLAWLLERPAGGKETPAQDFAAWLRNLCKRALPRRGERAVLALSAAAAFALLVAGGLAVSGIESLAALLPLPADSGESGLLEGVFETVFEGPTTALGGLVMVFSSLTTGYLEEGFFRYYLFRRLGEAGRSTRSALTAGVLLFAACHLYEGPLGVLNALLAGFSLSLVYLRTRARPVIRLHATALAHGAWNILVFTLW